MLYYSQNRDKNRMSRVPAFFMAALLLFSTIPVSLAQQNFIRANANADAIRDADRDMKRAWWLCSDWQVVLRVLSRVLSAGVS